MIKIYTIPKCSSCELYKRRLLDWQIPFEELPLLHYQNLHPEKIWSAPILEIGDKIYVYESIGESRDKLWKATHIGNTRIMDTETGTKTTETTTEKVKDIIKANSKKNKTEPIIQITEEIDQKITRIMFNIINSPEPVSAIELLTEHMSDEELLTFMLGWRLANHSDAIIWENKSIEFKDRAKMLDPYRDLE